MKQRPISTEGLNEHESRWRLLVFGVPHIEKNQESGRGVTSFRDQALACTGFMHVD